MEAVPSPPPPLGPSAALPEGILHSIRGQLGRPFGWQRARESTQITRPQRLREWWRRRESNLTGFSETGLFLNLRRKSSPRNSRVPLNTRSIAPNQPQRRSSTPRQQRGRSAPHLQLRGGRDPRRAPHRGRPLSATRPRTTAWVPSNSAWDPPSSSLRSPGIGPSG